MTTRAHVFEIGFKNDNLNRKTTIIAYLNPKDLKMKYVNTNNNICYKSWERMALEEYKKRGLFCEKNRMYSNLVWEEINE